MAGLKRSFVGCVPGLFSEVGLRGVVTASPATGFGDPRLLMQRQARLVVAPIGGLGASDSPPYPINDPAHPRVSGENSS